MNTKKEQKKESATKSAEKAFVPIAEIISTLGCGGRVYEPKMPKALKK